MARQNHEGLSALTKTTKEPLVPSTFVVFVQVAEGDLRGSASVCAQKSTCMLNFAKRPSRICVGCSHGVSVLAPGAVYALRNAVAVLAFVTL